MLIRLAVLSSLLINLSLQANPARHQPSFLFISAEFPPHQPHPHLVPHPQTPLPIVARQYHGGSYGINKSGAHAPQLPSLLPSLAPLTLRTPKLLYMYKHPHLSIHTPPVFLSSHPPSNRANFPRIHPPRNYL